MNADAASVGLDPDADDEAEPLTIRPELAAKFDALTKPQRELFPAKVGQSDSARVRVDVCTRLLRHNGFTLAEAIELSRHFPDGYGKLRSQSRAVLGEIWRELERDEAQRTRRELLMRSVSAAGWRDRKFSPEHALLGGWIISGSRSFIVGPTGAGKTNFGLALAGGIASREGFLHWRTDAGSPRTVLYLDGEMPARLLARRIDDLDRRLGRGDALESFVAVSWQTADELAPLLLDPAEPDAAAPKFAPLNTPEGYRWMLRLCDVFKPDVVFFDNVQCLVAGDHREETPWNETLPLIAALTAQGVAQVWFDHTGWNSTRQYGSATKGWQFDTVAVMAPVAAAERRPGELAFTLTFDPPAGKARRRTPENWREFAPCTIRLADDRWTSTGQDAPTPKPTGKAPPPLARKFHDALVDALAVTTGNMPGATTKTAWASECVRLGLIEPPPASETSAGRGRRLAPLRKAQQHLLAAGWLGIDGERVTDLRQASQAPSE